MVSAGSHAFRVRKAREQGDTGECKRRGRERGEGLCVVTLLGGEEEEEEGVMWGWISRRDGLSQRRAGV